MSARRRAEVLWQDLRYAARTLARAPGFAVVVVLSLAVGGGCLSAVFGVADAVLLRALPLPGAERVRLVWARSAETPETWLSYPEYADLRERAGDAAGALERVAAMRDVRLTVSGDGEPEEVPALAVAADLFPALGVGAALGRTLRPSDDRAGAERVALLSDGYWRRRFGADPAVIGRRVTLSGEAHVIAGVLPRGFRLLPPSSVFPRHADVWVALEPTLGDGLRAGRDIRFLHLVARLRPAATPARAQAELDAVARALRERHPDTYADPGWGLHAVGYREHVVRGVRPALVALLAAAALLLVVVCSNVASVVLARHTARDRELATRLALGAGRARIAWQLVAEAALLAAAGGALGLLLAWAGVAALRTLGPASLPRLDEVAIDARTAAFAAAVSALAALLFGLLPALQAAGQPPGGVLRESGRGTAGSRSRARMRRALVVGQLALAMALLVATGLVGKSWLRLTREPLGFDPSGILTARVSLSATRFPSGAERARFLDDLVREVGAAPRVEAAAVVTQLPLSGAVLGSTFEPEPAGAGDAPTVAADLRGVTPEYFRAMRIPVVRGRVFGADEGRGAPPVAVIDRTLAERLWPGRDAVGRRIRWTRSGEWLEIVGVVGAVKHAGVGEPPAPTVYRPFAQYATMTTVYVAARGRATPGGGTPASLATVVRREVQRLAPDHAAADVRPMEARVDESSAETGFHAILLATFAAVALLLSSLGVFGLVAHEVSQRTREIGIRVALGARPAQVVWMLARRTLRLVAAGLALGLGIAFVMARGLAALLFGVSAADPVVYALVPLALGGVAVAATLLPARRAAAIDPGVALHAD